MTSDQDDRIGQLLRQDAPPERDALFRLAVLERRERQRYRQRTLFLIAGAVVLAGLIGFVFGMGADPFAMVAIVMLCVAMAACIVMSAPGVAEVARRLRSAQRPGG